jgi:pyruvate-ferredoxin/flavodoxin oxidoreductase
VTTSNSFKIVDGNEATVAVAYRAAEVIAIYPITPSSTMGELADQWATEGRTNLRGTVPRVIEMQSEGGAAGAVHGALQAGALTTTFTASQGLLLMIPNLYKIAGELTPFVIHVAARAVATHALSIFGDHSDVMACRQTGLALLAAGSVQEAQDLAAVAHAATLTTRVPFMHFFDGFRTSHELSRIRTLSDADLTALIDEASVAAHRRRALTPDRPVIRGTAQNPDTYFQAREAVNPYYAACPAEVQRTMDRLAERTGRHYRLFDYHGHPEAERVIVVMGSGGEVAHEAVDALMAGGEKVGVVKVRLYRPFSVEHFLAALPEAARAVAVLDRTKEPGAVGEPLYQDVMSALTEARQDGVARARWPTVVGGRYGLSSKEFDPAMVMGVFDNLRAERPRNHFTVGIVDDVSGTSLPWNPERTCEEPDVVRAVFYGLGSDGTVSANKNSIKIIGEETGRHVQAYFVYDSKKSGAMTVSHLRFGPRPIRSSYLVRQASFVACHQFGLLRRVDVLERAAPGATVLFNAPHRPDAVFAQLPREVQETLLARRLRLHVIDADRVARETGLAGRINTIMQTCFFALSGVLPRDEAIAQIKRALEKSYAKAGAKVIEANLRAVDAALSNLFEVELPENPALAAPSAPLVPASAPDFVQRVQAALMAGQGDRLPVSAFPVDGTWPTGTAKFEKRNLADELPVWDPALCIQCNKCTLACPHAAIRARVFDPARLGGAPATFRHTPFKAAAGGPWSELAGLEYALQVAPEDCTGCGACVEVCPAHDRSDREHRAIDMRPQAPLREAEAENLRYFLDLPETDHAKVPLDVRGSQLREPLFEYSGACAGCGETPYLKLLTQLFGDRLVIANATGCSSIYGGNLPTTPYTVDRNGRGPAWANSLFEDNAEFGLGIRLAIDQHTTTARRLVGLLAVEIGMPLAKDLLEPLSGTDAGIAAARERVARLRERLAACDRPEARELELCADYLVKKSVWIVGGDGWAYDIGFGGLDHVLASGHDVNVLVLDTQVYSNTGGQASKATPLGATAKFATAGKAISRKDLGMIAMSYGHVYVASTAYGAKDQQTVKSLIEAEAHAGPSLVVAYSPCIAHGFDLAQGPAQSRRAVDSGAWLLYRFDPARTELGQAPLALDSAPPKLELAEYMRQESRFRLTETADPERYRELTERASEESRARRTYYEQLARLSVPPRSRR